MGGALASHAAWGVAIRLVTTTSGEEGEIRQEGAATRETLGSIRRVELSCAVRALGLAELEVLSYRDSGMAGAPSNKHPRAFINAPAEEVVELLVAEIRRYRPQVVLTFEPGGLYGHPDHIAISNHTTQAFKQASDQSHPSLSQRVSNVAAADTGAPKVNGFDFIDSKPKLRSQRFQSFDVSGAAMAKAKIASHMNLADSVIV